MFHMANDSGLFRTAVQLGGQGCERSGSAWKETSSADGKRYLPLIEAKMFHQYDHRWSTYDGDETRDLTEFEKREPSFIPAPRYWIAENEVAARLSARGWQHQWIIGWRDITNPTNERTMIASVLPYSGAGHTVPILLLDPNNVTRVACLIANLSTLVVDYVARQKVGGTHLVLGILKQLPVLSPDTYSDASAARIKSIVLELIFNSNEMTAFVRDLGFDGPPFPWNEDRRAELRAELDAWYARAYGLTRDELRYILDPADVMGEDYPSETFRVLKNNEMKKYGEYRTRRLVLEAWDRMEAGDLK
jgi:hypothetical protein